MPKKKIMERLLLPAFLLLIIVSGAAAEDKTMVGTLSASIDSQNNTVTAMFVGYCEGEPVIIGPVTWSSSAEDFNKASAEDIGNKLCVSSNASVKKVTKATKTGKDIVAEIVVTGPGSSIMVGR